MSAARNQEEPQHKAVLEAPEIRRALTRIAHEILERTKGGSDVVLLGVQTEDQVVIDPDQVAARVHPVVPSSTRSAATPSPT